VGGALFDGRFDTHAAFNACRCAIQKRFGVLEIALSQQDKPGSRLLQKLPFCAITFGHIVIGLTEHHLECLRDHEHEHVRQYERWGLLFFLAYPASSLYQWIRGNNAYWDNWFEVQARLGAANAENET
jgi:hypothetical protein